MGFKAEPLSLEWDGAAAGKWIEYRRRIVVGRAQNLGAHLVEKILVVDVVPVDHSNYEVEETSSLLLDAVFSPRLWIFKALCDCRGLVFLKEVARVVDEL